MFSKWLLSPLQCLFDILKFIFFKNRNRGMYSNKFRSSENSSCMLYLVNLSLDDLIYLYNTKLFLQACDNWKYVWLNIVDMFILSFKQSLFCSHDYRLRNMYNTWAATWQSYTLNWKLGGLFYCIYQEVYQWRKPTK